MCRCNQLFCHTNSAGNLWCASFYDECVLLHWSWREAMVCVLNISGCHTRLEVVWCASRPTWRESILCVVSQPVAPDTMGIFNVWCSVIGQAVILEIKGTHGMVSTVAVQVSSQALREATGCVLCDEVVVSPREASLHCRARRLGSLSCHKSQLFIPDICILFLKLITLHDVTVS